MPRRHMSNRATPCCEHGLLHLGTGSALHQIAVGSPAWFDWLADPANTRFYVAGAGFTARRELRRGRWYWYAYAKRGGVLRKAYLGRAGDLSLERLNAGARALDAPARANRPRLDRAPDLLASKLTLPALRPRLLARPRLLDRLDAGQHARLIVLVAPAGYGKTSLLVDWAGALSARRSAPAVAWVALDAGDNDATRFWRYLLLALDQLRPGVAAAALALLAAPEPPAIRLLLTTLLNQLAAAPAPGLMLMLDDYHLIDQPAIHAGLAWLLAHAPPNLQLVLAARTAPPLPLARLHAAGQLLVLRAADLSFTPAEIGQFLTDVMHLQPAAASVAALARSTEGWIVGVQLAALSWRAAGATGHVPAGPDHVDLLDYLADEVFAGLPPHLQQFMLYTAPLGRMCGPLCDAVLYGEAGPAGGLPGAVILEELARADLFVVPLDQQRRWYRYHHLFAEFLRSRLARSASVAAPLVQRAAAWCEQQGLLAEAIGYALAGGAVDHAARMIVSQAEYLTTRGEVQTLLGWLAALPPATLRADPDLSLWYAWMLALTRRLGEVEPWLRQVEALLAGPRADRQMLGQVAAVRATVARAMGDHAGTIAFAQQALARLPANNLILRGVVALNLGLAQLAGGELEPAGHALAEANALSQASRHVLIQAGAADGLARLHVRQGRLHQAAHVYRQAIVRLSRPAGRVHAAPLQVGLAGLLYEWDDRAAARALLAEALPLLDGAEQTLSWYTGQALQARIDSASGDLAAALDCCEQAAQLAPQRQAHPALGYVAGWRARILAAHGCVAEALEWARVAELSAAAVGEAGALPALALADALLAAARQGDPAGAERALVLLGPACTRAEAQGHQGDLVAILAAQALAAHMLGERAAAQAAIERALQLAAPAGLIRTFADYGAPMAALLRQAIVGGVRLSHAQAVLRALGAEATPAGAEVFTAREIEIARLLAHGCSNTEIARRLQIAIGTARWHVKRIYAKLDVHTRALAVLRACELGFGTLPDHPI